MNPDRSGSSFLLYSWLTHVGAIGEVESSTVRTPCGNLLRYMVYARFWIRRKPFYFIASLLFPTAVVTIMGGLPIMVAAGASPNSIVMLGSGETLNIEGTQINNLAKSAQRGKGVST